MKAKTHIFSEWYALDLVKDAYGRIGGLTAMNIESGEIVFFNPECVFVSSMVMALSTVINFINTGDGWYGFKSVPGRSLPM